MVDRGALNMPRLNFIVVSLGAKPWVVAMAQHCRKQRVGEVGAAGGDDVTEGRAHQASDAGSGR